MRINQLLWLVPILSLFQIANTSAQAIVNPQCSSMPASIWVKLVARPPQQGPIYVDLGLEDYVSGVLEGEMSPIPGIARFEDGALGAGAIAMRTWGAYHCRKRLLTTTPTTIYGVCDTSSGIQGCYDQEYFPGHSGDSARYLQQTSATEGIHLRYNGTILDAQHRARNGDPTNPVQNPFTVTSYPYLKSVPDPVSASDGRSQTDSQSVGLSQVGSNYWISGIDPTLSDALHPRWTSNLQVLSHYYTGVQIRTGSNLSIAPSNRWVPLRNTWNTPNGQPPLRMGSGEQKTVTVWVQNAGTTTWTADGTYYFAYETLQGLQTLQSSGQSPPTTTIPPGGTYSATLIYTAPIVSATGCLSTAPFFQMYKRINNVSRGFNVLSIEEVGTEWPRYFVNIFVGNGCKNVYLPTIQNGNVVTQ